MKYEVSKESYVEGLEDKPEPEIIVIDIEKAEKISKNNKFKSKTTALKNKLKSLTFFSKNKVKITEQDNESNLEKKKKKIVSQKFDKKRNSDKDSNNRKEVNRSTLKDKDMNIFSSTSQFNRNPVSKPPSTKASTVTSMIKRLSTENLASPPPKPNIMKIPDAFVQHNNNQPFSYTNQNQNFFTIVEENPNEVVYAQVVCPNGTSKSSKYTVHTSYNQNFSNKNMSSDSDEGLGKDEMHAQKNGKQTLTNIDKLGEKTKEISARRDLLESRINQRLRESNKILKDIQLENKKIQQELNSRYTNQYSNKISKRDTQKKNYSSLTELNSRNEYEPIEFQNKTHVYYTEKHKTNRNKNRLSNASDRKPASLYNKSMERRSDNKKLVDSGIENDIFYESSELKHFDSDEVDNSTVNKYYMYKKSHYEDVEYSEPIVEQDIKKRIEFESKTLPNKRNSRSHYNKANVDTMKYRTESSSMPQLYKEQQNTDKKRGIDKVKGLFKRDKKQNENKPGLAREESLKARYKEYNGSDNKITLSNASKSKHAENKKSRNLRFFGDSDSDKNAGTIRSVHRSKQNGKLSKSSERLSENKHRESGKATAYTTNSNRKLNGVQRTPSSSPVFRKNYKISSPRSSDFNPAESSTEGENSQPSQRSVVYLHAAKVGDIPSPRSLRKQNRAYSREELSLSRQNLQPQIKTLSRSFSMLAPWRPRNNKSGTDIDYSPKTLPKGDKYRYKSLKKSKMIKNSDDSAYDSKEKSYSRENLSKKKLPNEAIDNAYYKKNNNRFSQTRYPREEKSVKLSASRSMESLRDPKKKASNQKINRSKSIPKNTNKPRFI